MRAAVNPNKRQIESNKPKQVHRFKKAKITSERSTVRSTEETKSQHNSREGSKSTVLSGPRIGKGRVVHAGQHYLTIQNSPASCSVRSCPYYGGSHQCHPEKMCDPCKTHFRRHVLACTKGSTQFDTSFDDGIVTPSSILPHLTPATKDAPNVYIYVIHTDAFAQGCLDDERDPEQQYAMVLGYAVKQVSGSDLFQVHWDTIILQYTTCVDDLNMVRLDEPPHRGNAFRLPSRDDFMRDADPLLDPARLSVIQRACASESSKKKARGAVPHREVVAARALLDRTLTVSTWTGRDEDTTPFNRYLREVVIQHIKPKPSGEHAVCIDADSAATCRALVTAGFSGGNVIPVNDSVDFNNMCASYYRLLQESKDSTSRLSVGGGGNTCLSQKKGYKEDQIVGPLPVAFICALQHLEEKHPCLRGRCTAVIMDGMAKLENTRADIQRVFDSGLLSKEKPSLLEVTCSSRASKGQQTLTDIVDFTREVARGARLSVQYIEPSPESGFQAIHGKMVYCFMLIQPEHRVYVTRSSRRYNNAK